MNRSFFRFFASFWVTKLKPYSGKGGKVLQTIYVTIWLSEAEKRMFWALENTIFLFFANFWVTKTKPSLGKVKQSVQTFLNQNLVIESFLENCFEVILSSKAEVLRVWKEQFSILWKFLSDEVEFIFWESHANRSKLLKATLVIFFSFFVFFWATELKPFFWEVRKSLQNYLNQKVNHRELVTNIFSRYVELKGNGVSVWKEHFSKPNVLTIWKKQVWAFCKSLNDKVESIFWESEPKCRS